MEGEFSRAWGPQNPFPNGETQTVSQLPKLWSHDPTAVFQTMSLVLVATQVSIARIHGAVLEGVWEMKSELYGTVTCMESDR